MKFPKRPLPPHSAEWWDPQLGLILGRENCVAFFTGLLAGFVLCFILIGLMSL